MREDLIGAKGYTIGYKAIDCGDRCFCTMIVSNYDVAIAKLSQWEARGWKTRILPVK